MEPYPDAGLPRARMRQSMLRSRFGSRRRRASPGEPEAPVSTVLGAPPETALTELGSGDSDELSLLLQEIEHRAIAATTSPEQTTLERWIRVPVTDSIMLSVRNISEQDAEIVEQLAQLLRRLGGL